jgi:hypothetical protein
MLLEYCTVDYKMSRSCGMREQRDQHGKLWWRDLMTRENSEYLGVDKRIPLK